MRTYGMTYKKISKNIILISNSDFAKSSLPRESFLHMDKSVLLDKSVFTEEVAEMTSSFMDSVVRAMIIGKSKLYYEKFHKPIQHKEFIQGKDYISYAGRVYENKYGNYEDAEKAIRSDFVLGGHKAFYVRKATKRISLSIVSELDSNMLNRWGLNAYNSVREAVEEEINKNMYENAKIGIVKNGLAILLNVSGG